MVVYPAFEEQRSIAPLIGSRSNEVSRRLLEEHSVAEGEKAVALFLAKKIGFTRIYDIIENCMEAIEPAADPSVEEILETEQRVYALIRGWQ